MSERAALILAGGKAKRFQTSLEEWRDKALAKLFGVPLIVHVVKAAKNVVDEIIICVNNEARSAIYSKVLKEHSISSVKFCIDEEFAGVKGPLTAIATGLKNSKADYCTVLPCDVPLIKPMVIDHLLNAVKGSSVAVPTWPDGRLESLMLTCERAFAAQISIALCELGRRRPDDIVRGACKVNFVSTIGELKKLDPELKSFVNINFLKDLEALPKRVGGKGPITSSLNLSIGCPDMSEFKQLKKASEYIGEGKFFEASDLFSSLSANMEERGLNFWSAIIRENEGEALLKGCNYIKVNEAFTKAAEDYRLEAEFYERNQVGFLAKRARIDEQRVKLRYLKR
ncbi:MAG: molybdenum cofactor guanylyltransferase [Candidatus Bathyarchaeia archaeon]